MAKKSLIPPLVIDNKLEAILKKANYFIIFVMINVQP